MASRQCMLAMELKAKILTKHQSCQYFPINKSIRLWYILELCSIEDPPSTKPVGPVKNNSAKNGSL